MDALMYPLLLISKMFPEMISLGTIKVVNKDKKRGNQFRWQIFVNCRNIVRKV